MEPKRKTVFISYSWDNEKHQSWVLKLANDLMETFGIIVIIDQYELSAGKDLPHFMESSIEKADKVLIILTPNYKIKAESRSGGAGYETSMISQEIFQSPITNIKFIPILRSGNIESSSPKFLSSKIYHSMEDDNKYNVQLHLLAKTIYELQLIKKPELGAIPDFENINIDPLIDIANSLKREEEINREIDYLLHSHQGVNLLVENIENLKKLLKDRIKLYESTTDLRFSSKFHRDTIIIGTSGFSVSFQLPNLHTGSAQNSKLLMRYWTGYLSVGDFGAIYLPGEEPKRIKEKEYIFDLTYSKEPVWKTKAETITIDEIASKSFTFLIEKIQNEKLKNFRGK